MKRWMTPLATIAGISVMIACASAQEAPIPAQGDKAPQGQTQTKKPVVAKKQAKPAEKKQAADNPTKSGDEAKADDQAKKGDTAKGDAADEPEAKPLYNSLTLGYNTWKSTNHISGIHQNGYVQGGFGIADLSILMPFETDQFYAFDYMGTPGNDFGTRLVGRWGASTSLNVHAHQFSFLDPSFATTKPSTDSGWDATLEHQIAPNFGAFATFKYQEGQHHFPAPYDQPNFNVGTFTLGAQKEVGANTFGATFTENRYNDLTTVQPTTLTDQGEIRYTGNWGSRFTALGSASVARIMAQGRPDSWVHSYSVGGVYDVNENSTLGGSLSQTVLNLNSVQNAYVRKRNLGGVRLDTHLQKWALGLGYQHREEERVRWDHSFIDVPKWNIYDFKLNGRVLPGVRFGLKGSTEDLVSAPIFQTADPSLLYWNRKTSVQAKFDSGNDITTGYFSYTYRYRRNDIRGYSLNWHNFALGGSRVVSPKLLGYAEFASDLYTVDGTSPDAAALGGYFPTSETFMVGLDFTRNERENLSLVLSSFYTQDQWGQQIAMTYRRDLGKERNIQITFSPWLQRDRLYDVDNFDAAILTVKAGVRF